MDGRNFHGNRISLLNDAAAERISGSARRTSPQAPPHHHHARLTYRQSRTHSHSSTLSYSTSNSGPPTPQLVRSGSSDSAEMQRTPSPLTPDLNFDALAVTSQKYADPATAFASASPYHASAHHISQQYLDAPRSPLISEYVDQSQLAGQKRSMYEDVPELPIEQADPQESRSSFRQNGSSSRSNRNGKNQYPCPLARQYQCQDFFTTSGHAARHAKKHTGRKDALCPECNKAFTRKDNMEQHRRTHLNGRKASKETIDSPTTSKRAKTPGKRMQPLAIQASISDDADPTASMSPISYSSYTNSAVGPAPQPYPADVSGQSAYSYPHPPHYDSSSLTGLDTLAIAASGESIRSPPAY